MGRTFLAGLSVATALLLQAAAVSGADKEAKPPKVPVSTARANARGNELLVKGEYGKAADVYREEALKRPENGILQRNLAGALARSGQAEEGLAAYTQAVRFAANSQEKAKVLYDLGNTLATAGQLQPAMESLAQAMFLDPDDLDIKHNFEFLMKKMEEQQKQQQQSKDQKDQQKNDQQQQSQEPQKKDDKESQQEQPQQQQQKEPQQQPSEPETMNPEDAQRLLDALREEEKELLAELQKRQQLQHKNVEKDW